MIIKYRRIFGLNPDKIDFCVLYIDSIKSSLKECDSRKKECGVSSERIRMDG